MWSVHKRIQNIYKLFPILACRNVNIALAFLLASRRLLIHRSLFMYSEVLIYLEVEVLLAESIAFV